MDKINIFHVRVLRTPVISKEMPGTQDARKSPSEVSHASFEKQKVSSGNRHAKHVRINEPCYRLKNDLILTSKF